MTETTEDRTDEKSKAPLWRRMLPLLVLVAGFGLVFALGLHKYVSYGALLENRQWLTERIASNALEMGAAFMLVYVAVAALSIPVGSPLTIIGGFLFGSVVATVWIVFGATIGAVALFLAARYAFRDALRAKAGRFLKSMEAGFREDALSYMFVLRLVPLFPFWAVNLVPALLGVNLGTYVIGTFFGIIAGTFVFASVGNGLGAILDRCEMLPVPAGATVDEAPSGASALIGGDGTVLREATAGSAIFQGPGGGTFLCPEIGAGIILQPQFLVPIVGLIVLAMIPPVYKRIRARRAASRAK